MRLVLSSVVALSALSLSACAVDGTTASEGTLQQSAQELASSNTIFDATSIVKGASKSGTYAVSAAGQLTFETAGTGDVDLYVRKGGVASRSKYTCKSDGNTAAESCTIPVAAGDSISYLVYAYAASRASLTVSTAAAAESNLGPVPSDVQAFLTKNGWGMMHLRWHTVRQWDRLSSSALASAKAQGWTRSPIQEGEPGNGLQFLAMHRVMFRQMKAQFPAYADTVFRGWASVPTDPRDPLNSLPNGATTPFSSNMLTAVTNLTTNPASFADDDAWGLYLETSFRPTPTNPSARSSDPTTGLHNYLHNRFADESSPITMGDPSVNLGNKMFWKLHGWIDEQWSAYRAAKGLSDSDPAYTKALADAEAEMNMGGMGGMGGMSSMETRLRVLEDVAPIRAMFNEEARQR